MKLPRDLKGSDLAKALCRDWGRNACVLLREGANHSWWLNPLKNKRSAISKTLRDSGFIDSQDL
jgi:hypothetical protein